MSIRRGNKILASSTTNGFSLFDCKWADHILNNISWLRADTFSWQSGDVYVAAYEHLLYDFDNRVGKGTDTDGWLTETIDGVTIYYIVAPDGHKICVSDNEANVQSLYEKTGVAWYYILDQANKQFKLPRTKFGFTGVRSGVGGYVEPGLPNITGSFTQRRDNNANTVNVSGAFSYANTGGSGDYWYGNNNASNGQKISFDASVSNNIYGNSDTVQPQATEMYLYFYVGNYVEDITTIDAGKLAEAVNDFDIDTFKPQVDEVKNEAISDINQTTSDSVEQLKNMGEVVNYTNISNCITEIPQDIKLELSDGVLTLKSGSKVHLAYGNLDDTLIIESDITLTNIYSGKYMIIRTSPTAMYAGNIETCLSGTIANRPSTLTRSTGLYFATDENKIYLTGDSGSTWYSAGGYTLPLGIMTVSDGAISSIDQVFNGFGYIGSTLFALSGVKGLIPNGRNDDGSLNNIRFTTERTITATDSSTSTNALTINNPNIIRISTTNYFYDEEKNIIINKYNNKQTLVALYGFCKTNNGVVSEFTTNTAFHAVDYSDTDFIATQPMPSNRYNNLSLGASGTTYTAPADGWVYIQIMATTASNSWGIITVDNIYSQRLDHTRTNAVFGGLVPVRKGVTYAIDYGSSTFNTHRFIYSNGSK